MEYLHFYIKEGTANLIINYQSSYVTTKFSYDKINWLTPDNGQTIQLIPDKKVYFKGTISKVPEYGDKQIINFEGDGSPLYAGGSIMSLQDGNPDETNIKYESEFFGLFKGCRNLVTAPDLPATTLKSNCYEFMFKSCNNLTTAPELPATTLYHYCYRSMFEDCTHLVNAPELPATTLADSCYYAMFSGCTLLLNAPELPATTLAPYCYAFMFQTCGYLVNAPALPATTLADGCYKGMFSYTTYIETAPELPATTLSDYCYESMFNLSTGLVNAPALPATTLTYRCYENMFSGCRHLLNAPALPATTLTDSCYRTMFFDCSSLVNAPELPATTLAYRCYENMFRSCKSLTNAPELPATTLAEQCYYGMFMGCENLITAPKLPATTLADNCYEAMFYQCYNLTNAPELPATTLAPNCYREMFEQCSILKKAPFLPATVPVEGCYEEMFMHCNRLNYVKCLLKPDTTNCTTNWLSDVALDGTFVKNEEVDNWERSDSGIPKLWNVENIDATFDGLTFTSIENSTISLSNVGGNEPDIWYSNNTVDWTKWDYSTIELAKDSKIYFKGNNGTSFSKSTSQYSQFVMTGKIAASGNIMSLIYGDNFEGQVSLSGKDYCFISLFYDCKGLTTAPELPATTLSERCYGKMFSLCTNLTTAPALPATTLTEGCYEEMFYYCIRLTNAPDLPATTLAEECYHSMFSDCISIVKAPDLPAKTLARSCYWNMFWNCTSITTAPVLPATKLEPACYNSMFGACKSLTNAPELPAATLENNCYGYMFDGCVSLTNAPELIAIKPANFCYQYMFFSCSKLNYVKCLLKPNATDYTYNWLNGVASSGTFVKNKNFNNWGEGDSGIPVGWTVQNSTEDETFTITVTSNDTEHCSVFGNGQYIYGAKATIKCVPSTGYEFVQWNDGNTDATREVTVTSDATFTATIRKLHTVTLNGDNCTLIGAGNYSDGANVEISCVPYDLYEFVQWSDGNTNATRTITVTEDITLTAVTRAITSNILEIKARKGSGEYERTNIIWYIDYKGETFSWDAKVETDYDNLTTNVEISDGNVTNISKGSSWIGDGRIYSFDMTVPRNDSDTDKEFTINITSTNRILSDSITVRVVQRPKLPVLIEDIFVSSGDVENALVTIPDTMGEVLVVYEGDTLAKYTIDDCVSNYVLYYRNALGGIDLFPVTGKVIKSNDIEHLTINKKYDNRTLNFGNTNYENVLTERWQLYSGRLTDQQSKLMHHLINSTYVYLYDIQADKFTPVVITDTEMEYKTYKNNNNKMVYYTINVEASQTKYRR